jgi:hypothetical protein
MSEIAEIRKIFQDLIARDVKSIATELASFKSSVDKQFAAVEKQFVAAEALAQARYTTVLAKLETMEAKVEGKLETFEAVQSARHEAITKALDVDRRLEKIEARQAATAAA